MEATRKLANVRIHVERVIGAVRQRFKILDATSTLPTEYTRSKGGGPVLIDSIVAHYTMYVMSLSLLINFYRTVWNKIGYKNYMMLNCVTYNYTYIYVHRKWVKDHYKC